jgi:hypothetical protein
MPENISRPMRPRQPDATPPAVAERPGLFEFWLAIEASDLDAIDRSVALAVARRAGTGGTCYASAATLASATGHSPRRTASALKTLEGEGWLVRVSGSAGRAIERALAVPQPMHDVHNPMHHVHRQPTHPVHRSSAEPMHDVHNPMHHVHTPYAPGAYKRTYKEPTNTQPQPQPVREREAPTVAVAVDCAQDPNPNPAAEATVEPTVEATRAEPHVALPPKVLGCTPDPFAPGRVPLALRGRQRAGVTRVRFILRNANDRAPHADRHFMLDAPGFEDAAQWLADTYTAAELVRAANGITSRTRFVPATFARWLDGRTSCEKMAPDLRTPAEKRADEAAEQAATLAEQAAAPALSDDELDAGLAAMLGGAQR